MARTYNSSGYSGGVSGYSSKGEEKEEKKPQGDSGYAGSYAPRPLPSASGKSMTVQEPADLSRPTLSNPPSGSAFNESPTIGSAQARSDQSTGIFNFPGRGYAGLEGVGALPSSWAAGAAAAPNRYDGYINVGPVMPQNPRVFDPRTAVPGYPGQAPYGTDQAPNIGNGAVFADTPARNPRTYTPQPPMYPGEAPYGEQPVRYPDHVPAGYEPMAAVEAPFDDGFGGIRARTLGAVNPVEYSPPGGNASVMTRWAPVAQTGK